MTMGRPFPVFRWTGFSYDETRGINAHIDYPTHEDGGPYYQLLFKMPGYKHSIYREAEPGGIMHLEDGKLHDIRIELKDAYGNISSLVFKAQYQAERACEVNFIPGRCFIRECWMEWNRRMLLFTWVRNCLYDSVHLDYQESPGHRARISFPALYQIRNTRIPLADTMTVRIKIIRIDWIRNSRCLCNGQNGEDFEVKKPAWLGDWATASFQEFRKFQLGSGYNSSSNPYAGNG